MVRGGRVHSCGRIYFYSVLFGDISLFHHDLQNPTNQMRHRLLNLDVAKGGFRTLKIFRVSVIMPSSENFRILY